MVKVRLHRPLEPGRAALSFPMTTFQGSGFQVLEKNALWEVATISEGHKEDSLSEVLCVTLSKGIREPLQCWLEQSTSLTASIFPRQKLESGLDHPRNALWATKSHGKVGQH